MALMNPIAIADSGITRALPDTKLLPMMSGFGWGTVNFVRSANRDKNSFSGSNIEAKSRKLGYGGDETINGKRFRPKEAFRASSNINSCESPCCLCEISFVIVPTPSDQQGVFSNKFVLGAVEKIGAALRKSDHYHVVNITSTVMPGSTEGEIRACLERASGRTVGVDEPLVASAKALQAELRAEGVRATVDITTDPIKAKVANAEQMKVHHMLVIGPRDLEAGNVSVRIHGKGNLGAKPRAEVVADIFAAIKERRA